MRRRGGLELLMGNVKEHAVTVDEAQGQSGISMKQVIAWIKVLSVLNMVQQSTTQNVLNELFEYVRVMVHSDKSERLAATKFAPSQKHGLLSIFAGQPHKLFRRQT